MALQLQQLLAHCPLDVTARAPSKQLTGLARSLGLPAPDAIAALHQLLDHALEHNVTSWIVDYLVTVCADPNITSHDPVDAHLLDQQVMLDWAAAGTQRLQQRLQAVLSQQGARSGAQDAGDLQRNAAVLLQVVAALQHSSGQPRADLQKLEHTLELVQQAAQALDWCAQRGFLRQPPMDAAAMSQWQQRLRHQRRHLPGNRLFLDDAIAQLDSSTSGTFILPTSGSSSGSLASAYPFNSVQTAIAQLFASGSPAPDAHAAKAWLLLYHLLVSGALVPSGLSAGALGSSDAVHAFGATFRLPAAQLAQCQAAWLLDGADPTQSSAAARLDGACQLLKASADADAPFKFVEALLAFGRPGAALAVQSARGGRADGGAGSLHEQATMLQVRLACGLLSEAHAAARGYCMALSGQQRTTAVRVLMKLLAEWAAFEPPQALQDAAGSTSAQQQQGGSVSRLQRVGQLPLDGDEESALVAWLQRAADKGDAAGEFLPLFLLQRNRIPEALVAYATWQRTSSTATASTSSPHNTASPSTSLITASPSATAAATAKSATATAATAQRQQLLADLMSAAAASLPPALRNAVLAPRTGASAVPLLQGVGRLPDADVPMAVLAPRGAEPPVFVAPALPNALAGSRREAGGQLPGFGAQAGAGSGAGAAMDVDEDVSRLGGASDDVAAPSLLDAGGSAAAAGAGAAATPAASAPVPNLFIMPAAMAGAAGTPAPAAAAGTAGGQAAAAQAGAAANTSHMQTPGGLFGASSSAPVHMSEAEFSQQVLGLQPQPEAPKTRSRRQTPGPKGTQGGLATPLGSSSKRARGTAGSTRQQKK